jgi:hypothetical protein
MRRFPRFLLSLVLMPLLAGLFAPALSAKETGYAASSITFSSVDPTGCLETTVVINAGTRAGTTAPYFEIDNLLIYDHCQQQTRVFAYFRTTTFVFRVHPRLVSATLVGTLPVITCSGDAGSCADLANGLEVELTMTGTGELVQHGGSSMSRAVTATGSVSSGTTNYAPATSVSGQLGRSRT